MFETERPEGYSPIGSRITIRLPDDFHHHGRQDEQTAPILRHVVARFGRCLFMPNLKPPVTTTQAALNYKQHIMQSLPVQMPNHEFLPLMVLYLTDHTTPQEIATAAAAGIVGCKYYPANATTNSEAGVTNIRNCYPALAELERHSMMLCIHSEVTTGDIFAREERFLHEVMEPLIRDFPTLKITMEHISTSHAVDFVLAAPETVKATITCHHLLYNRNDMLVGGIRPHLYCLPILKSETHRQHLLRAACSGSPKFFLGTDSAPHATDAKETVCGCAGVFTAHAALELYAEAFDRSNNMDRLEDFASSFGADHYGLERSTNDMTITLEKQAWTVPDFYDFGDGKRLRPLRAGEQVMWRIVDNKTD